MKTLILNGSPRINGDTGRLIKIFTEKKIDEYKIIDAYRCNISACLDCRDCWKNNGCSINDKNTLMGLNSIYDFFVNRE